MKRSALALAFVILVAGGLGVPWFFKSNPQRNALQVRELATRELGSYLARVQPGARLLVFSNPFTRKPGIATEIVQMEDAGLRGLRAGIGSAAAIGAVVFPEVKPEARENARAVAIDPESPTPLSFLIAPETFDALIERHSDCNVVVSLIGLPADLEPCESWTKPGGAKFALLLPDLRLMGGSAAVKQAVESCKLLAFVLNRPYAPNDQKPPTGKSREEFEKRFLLVTAENLGDMMRRYPSLF
jgi:hypothetical protein